MTTEDHRARRLATLAESAPPEIPGDPLSEGRRGTEQPVGAASFTDTATDTEDRVAALTSARLGALDRPEVVNGLIAVLADQTDDPEVRRAAMGALGEMSFSSATFARYDADYRQALRVAATATDPTLATGALQVLSLQRDEYAQRLVSERLEDPSATASDRIQAMHLLASDVHAGQFPLLRRIATESTDPGERAAALRLLAADSDSCDILESSVGDRSESTDVRIAGAVALNTLDPEAFSPTARGIVRDPEDDDDLRAVCLTALSVVPGTPDGDEERLLVDASESNAPEPSQELQRAVEQYRDARAADRAVE